MDSPGENGGAVLFSCLSVLHGLAGFPGGDLRQHREWEEQPAVSCPWGGKWPAAPPTPGHPPTPSLQLLGKAPSPAFCLTGGLSKQDFHKWNGLYLCPEVCPLLG